MISIIICSRTAVISSSLKDNIEATIGVEYEIIVIDNSTNQYSIFQAYNKGVEQSKYSILCFMHDDILYHTNNWGKVVLKHFEDDAIGAVGIAGSPYAPFMHGSWWGSGLVEEIIIPWHNTDLKPVIKKYNNIKINKSQVVVIDGVLMFIRRTAFDKIKFDEINFDGYHFYDIDISLQINQLGYKLYCTFDIVIQHFSKANVNMSWLNSVGILHSKWQKYLPVSCANLSHVQQCKAEFRTLGEYIDIMLYNNITKKIILGVLVRQFSGFRKGYLYYKTPFYFFKYFNKIVKFNKI